MKTKDLQPGCCSTLTELSRASGFSYRAAQRWKNSPDFPIEPDGSYSIWKVAEWRVRTFEINNQPIGDSEISDLKQRKLQAETLQAEAMAEIRQLKAEQLTGDLVRRSAVKRFISTAFAIIRQRIEAQLAENAGMFPEEDKADMIFEWKKSNRRIHQGLSNTVIDLKGYEEKDHV